MTEEPLERYPVYLCSESFKCPGRVRWVGYNGDGLPWKCDVEPHHAWTPLHSLRPDRDQSAKMIDIDPRPCKGNNTNICVAEGCFAEACVTLVEHKINRSNAELALCGATIYRPKIDDSVTVSNGTLFASHVTCEECKEILNDRADKLLETPDVVYIPPLVSVPPPQKETHKCDLPGSEPFAEGHLHACRKECGQWWYIKQSYTNLGSYNYWLKVRWYHRKFKGRIEIAQREHDQKAVEVIKKRMGHDAQ